MLRLPLQQICGFDEKESECNRLKVLVIQFAVVQLQLSFSAELATGHCFEGCYVYVLFSRVGFKTTMLMHFVFMNLI